MSGSQVFISYRRNPSSTPYAHRLYDRAAERLGKDRVFIDMDTIKLGVDFVEFIDESLASAGALIAVIGPGWLTIQDKAGRRRLDDPNDLVRIEIATALARSDVRVFPVLVGGAEMPATADLPDDLAPLARRNGIELSDSRWNYDVGQLLGAIEESLTPAAPVEEPQAAEATSLVAEPSGPSRPRRSTAAATQPRSPRALRGRASLAGAWVAALGGAAALVTLLSSWGTIWESEISTSSGSDASGLTWLGSPGILGFLLLVMCAIPLAVLLVPALREHAGEVLIVTGGLGTIVAIVAASREEPIGGATEFTWVEDARYALVVAAVAILVGGVMALRSARRRRGQVERA